MTHQKRLSAPKHYPISKKENTYVSTVRGSRSKDQAIPANVFLRDVTEYAETDQEARKVVKNGDIQRNGDQLRDEKQGIGILDVVQLPKTEESFRVIRNDNNLEFLPTEDTRKAAKITGKKVQEEGQKVYQLHNGENHSSTENFTTGNTLIFQENKVEEVEMKEGSKVLVTSGSHAGETAQLQKINERGMNSDTAQIETEKGKELETKLENLLATGDLEVTQ